MSDYVFTIAVGIINNNLVDNYKYIIYNNINGNYK